MSTTPTTEPDRSGRPPRVVILGAGFGGLYAALELSRQLPRAGLAAEVVLVDRGERFVFKPLLYELLTDEVDEDDIAPPLDRVLPRGAPVRRIRAEVRAIDLAARTVTLASPHADHGAVAAHGASAGAGRDAGEERLAYDALLIALGAEPASYGIPGIDAHAFPVATLRAVHRLRAHVDEVGSRPAARAAGPEGAWLRTVAVVGAGASGVETALKLADRFAGARTRWRVVIVELAGSILPGFSEPTRAAAREALTRKGVELWLETAVAGADAHGLDLGGLDGRGKEARRRLPAATVVWTAGTRPPALVRELAGAPHDAPGRLRCEPTLALPGAPEVLAFGDCAAVRDSAGVPVPATAQAAVQEASLAARNVIRRLEGAAPLPFRYHHLGESLSLGRGEDVVGVGPVLLRGRAGHLVRRALYLVRLPGTEHRLTVGARWAARFLGDTVDGAIDGALVPALARVLAYAKRRAPRSGG